MNVHAWETPIRAIWHKSNTLIEVVCTAEGATLILAEDETRHRWKVEFDELVAFKVIRGENAKWSQEQLPPDGGFFEITESPWLAALGLTETNDQSVPHHYVICCVNEIIEFAAYGAKFNMV